MNNDQSSCVLPSLPHYINIDRRADTLIPQPAVSDGLGIKSSDMQQLHSSSSNKCNINDNVCLIQTRRKSIESRLHKRYQRNQRKRNKKLLQKSNELELRTQHIQSRYSRVSIEHEHMIQQQRHDLLMQYTIQQSLQHDNYNSTNNHYTSINNNSITLNAPHHVLHSGVDWSTVKHIIFLDIDNWGGFFDRMPYNLPASTMVYGIHKYSAQFNIPHTNEPYKRLLHYRHVHIERCLTDRHDASDYLLCIRMSELNNILSYSIVFTIISADNGFDTLVLHSPIQRKVQRFDPSARTNQQLYELIAWNYQ